MQLIPDATKTVVLQPYIGFGKGLIPSSARNLISYPVYQQMSTGVAVAAHAAHGRASTA
jgi:adenylyl- and sulfurtransferase ThiI